METAPAQNKIPISKAAKLVGVSPSTFRRLETQGKITSTRSSNGYRIFDLEDVLALKKELSKKNKSEKKVKQDSHLFKNQDSTKKALQEKQSILKAQKDIQRLQIIAPLKWSGTVSLAILIVWMSVQLILPNSFVKTTSYQLGVSMREAKEAREKVKKVVYRNFDVLGARSENPNFVLNINIPTNINGAVTINDNLDVTGISNLQSTNATEVNTPLINMTGAATLTNLLNIDDTTKVTLEDTLELAGDAQGVLSNVTVTSIGGVGFGDIEATGSNILMAQGGIWESVEQNQITALGTIETGEWQGTVITPSYGGTGLATYTTGDILYASNSTTLTKLNIGDAGYLLTSSGSAPQWQAVTEAVGDVLTTSTIFDGDVTGTYDAIDINANTIGDSELVDSLTYTGILNLAGTWQIGSTAVTANALELNFLDGTTVTAGGIMFGDGTKITQDAANLYWDDSNNFLGIGTTAPVAKLDIADTQTNTSGSLASSNIYTTLNPSSASSANYYANQAQLVIPTGNTSDFSGYEIPWFSVLTHNGTGTLSGLTAGSWSRIKNAAAGNIDTAYAVVGQIQNSGSGNITGDSVGVLSSVRNDGTGTLSNGYGFWATGVSNAGGTYSNYYAYYMPTLTGAYGNKFGLYLTDPGATNYLAGNVGIGTTAPTSMLSVGASSQFQVNSTGDIVKINNVTTSFPSSQGAANSFLRNDGAGTLTWADPAGTGVAGFWQRNGTNLSPTNIGDNVGIGTTNPGAKLEINAIASGIGVIVKANATTPGNIQEWQDSSGNILSGIASNGVPFADRNIGTANTFFGVSAGEAVITTGGGSNGNQNTLFGANAGNRVTTGYQNTLIGTGIANIGYLTGWQNVAVGINTLSNITSGNSNSAMGSGALVALTSSNENVAIGAGTLNKLTTGMGRNVALGASALSNSTTAYLNTAIGYASLIKNTTGLGNVAIGNEAGKMNETGSYSIYIGYGAGSSNTASNRTNSIIIGHNMAQTTLLGKSNILAIDIEDTETPLIYGEFNNDILTINGKVGIGTTNPVGLLTLYNANSSIINLITNNREFDISTFNVASGNYASLGYGGIGAVPANQLILRADGNVGIGTTAPTSMLSVGASSQFQVNSTGNIVKINDVTTSFPSSQGAANSFLRNDGAGTLTWADPAGTGVAGFWQRDGTSLAPANIGDNVGIGTTAPGVYKLYVSGDQYNTGTLTTTALIAPKWYPSADSTTAIQINKADGTTNVLNIDTTNGRVGIGTTAPEKVLHASGDSRIDGILELSPTQISTVLEAADTANDDNFGVSVSLSGNGAILAIGAHNWEGSSGTNRGGVYIYDWTGSTWVQRGSVLEAADAADVDEFGRATSLSADGTILAVGADKWEGTSGTDRGGVYIYDWNGTAWIQRGSVLEAADAANDDYFGTSVSLSADASILAVGSQKWEGTSGTDRGGVYIYDWNGTAWIQRGSVLEAADAANYDYFGASVSLSADASILAVGAHFWESTGVDNGAVYIYDWNDPSWVQRGSVLIASDTNNFDRCGTSTTLSANGSILAVGAYWWEDIEDINANYGGVYIYDWNGTTWIQRGSVLKAADAENNDLFGISSTLSANGSVLIVGAHAWEGTTGIGSGGVYTYSLVANARPLTLTHNGTGWSSFTNNILTANTSGSEKMRIDANGNIGVGTTNPTSMLSVGASSQFQVNSTGNIVKINNVTTSFPSSQGAANSFLRNDGAGTLTWADPAGTGVAGFWQRNGTSLAPTNIGDSVGIGTTNPSYNLEINGSTALSNWSIKSTLENISNSVFYTLVHTNGGSLNTSYQYRITLNTTNTGGDTGAKYLVWYDADTSLWNARAININGETGSHPIVFLDSGTPKVKINAVTPYDVRIITEAIYTGDTDSVPNLWGADYQWQRNVDSLYYTDGNVGIGTTNPGAKLEINAIASGIGVIVKANATTPGNIQEWQDSTGTVLSGVDEAGILFSHGETDVTNVFIGDDPGNATMTGTSNIAIGYQPAKALTTGSRNIAIGHWALLFSHTGNNNVAVGDSALMYSTGASNIAIGYQALGFTTTANSNTAIGVFALRENITGANNMAIGPSSGTYNETGSSNVFIGPQSGEGVNNSSNISNNTMIGYRTGTSALTGADNNTFLGYRAGYANTTGANNILLGYQVADTLTTGSTNIVIGYNIDLPAVDSSNMLDIGNLIYATGLTSTGTTISSGNVGIGTSSPTSRLSVGASSQFQVNSTGNIVKINNVTTSFPSSQGAANSFLRNDGAGTLTWADPAGTGVAGFWQRDGTSLAPTNIGDNVGIGTTNPLGILDIRGGKVGISGQSVIQTGYPREQLHVYDAQSAGDVAILISNSGNSSDNIPTASLKFRTRDIPTDLGSSAEIIVGRDGNYSAVNNRDANIQFWVENDDTLAEKLRINSTGYVGIGTTNPGAPLEVSGRISQLGLGGSTFLGYQAGLVDDLSDNYNTAVGYQALRSNTTGYYNTAMGFMALYANTTSNRNTANGMYALRYNTTGYRNTANGFSALFSNTTGNSNTANGESALYELGAAQTAGSFNIGTNYTIATAGTTDFTLIGAANNDVGTTFTATGIGTGTGTATPNGTNQNTAIGYNTGRGIIYGANNTILGANVGGLPAGLSNNIIIADGEGNRRINVDSTGNVGIGTISPASLLDLRATNRIPSATTTGILNVASTNAQAQGLGGTITLGGYRDDAATAFRVFASLEGLKETNGSGNAAGYLAFKVNNNGTLTEYLRIDSAGYVGIGTTSPTAKLDVRGNRSDTAGEGTINLGFSSIGNPYWAIRQSLTGSSGGSDLNFDRSWGGSGFIGNQPVMTLRRDSGNVGIGTTSPTSMLSVGASSQFQVNSTGNIVKINDVTTSFPSSQGAANSFLRNDGAGTLTWADPAGTGVAGFWQRNGTNLAPTNIGDYVGIGTTNPTRKLDVLGYAILGTQDGSITGSAATADSSLLINNKVTTDSRFFSLINNLEVDLSANSIDRYYGAYTYAHLSSNYDLDRLYGSFSGVRHDGTGLINSTIGQQGYISNTSSGAISSAYGVSGEVYQSGSGGDITYGAGLNANVDVSNGTMGYARGLQVWLTETGGAIGTAQGVYISDLEGTDTWGIYQEGADDNNYFAGNVGIGTTSPTSRLHIYDNTTAGGSGILVESLGSSGDAQITLNAVDDSGLYLSLNGVNQAYYYYDRGDDTAYLGGVSTTDLVIKANNTNRISLTDNYGKINAGWNSTAALIIEPPGSPNGDYFEIDSSTTLKNGDVFKIARSGNVGIGTTDPNNLLELSGTGSSLLRLNSSNSGSVGLEITQEGTQKATFYYHDRGANTDTLDIQSDGHIYLVPTGGVGIGTSSPVTKLDVNGTAWLRGTGTSGLFVDSAGNVGIGTTSPTAAELVINSSASASFNALALINSVSGTGLGSRRITFGRSQATNHQQAAIVSDITAAGDFSNGYLSFETQDSDALHERMRIDRYGNVGIGTTSPASLLEVQGGFTTTGSVLTLGTKETTVVANDVLGRINFYAPLEADGGDAILTGASIVAVAEGAFSSTVNSTSLQFQTGNSAAATTKMTIDENGNVGIGNSSPVSKLHVSDTGTPRLTLNSTTSDGSSELLFAEGLAGTAGILFHYDGNGGAGGTGQLNLLESTTTGRQLMSITREGNVGIGTSTPTAKLDIHAEEGATAGSGLRFTIGGNYFDTYITDDDKYHIDFKGNTLVTVKHDGKLGIGTTNPAIALDVVGSARFSAVGSSASTNDLGITADGTLTTNVSDISLKENFEPIDNALTKVIQLNPYYFTWKSNPELGRDIGLIAQDVANILPEASFTNTATGLMGINYSRFPALLIAGIKEQQILIDTMQSTIDSLNLDKNGNIVVPETQTFTTYDSAITTIRTDITALNTRLSQTEDLAVSTNTELATLKEEMALINDILGVSESMESTQSTESTDSIGGLGAILEQVNQIYTEFKEFASTLGLRLDEETNSLVIESNLNVLGDAVLTDIIVTGDAMFGLMKVDSLNNAINVTGPACYTEYSGIMDTDLCQIQTLYLQKTLAGNVDVFDGNIILNPNGNITIKGEVKAAKYSVDTTAESPSAGKATIPSGQTRIEIQTGALTDKSMVLVTPEIPVALGSKKISTDTFEIVLANPNNQAISVSWWIIN